MRLKCTVSSGTTYPRISTISYGIGIQIKGQAITNEQSSMGSSKKASIIG